MYIKGYEYPNDRQTPDPGNMEQIRLEFLAARASLSPSQFSKSTFREFKRKNSTKPEGTIIRNMIPIIVSNASIPNKGNLPFTNLKSITRGRTVNAVPDFFNGDRLGDINKLVKEDLSQIIIPTKHTYVPVVPNFFLEAKAPRSDTDVARRQACYDRAYGARAMHSLQSYGKQEPVYDGNAYIYTATYLDGQLKLYAHHVTAPTTPAGRPGYHMTQVDTYGILLRTSAHSSGATKDPSIASK